MELDELIKQCAALTTSPPDLLEHIAREAHHFMEKLRGASYTVTPRLEGYILVGYVQRIGQTHKE